MLVLGAGPERSQHLWGPVRNPNPCSSSDAHTHVPTAHQTRAQGADDVKDKRLRLLEDRSGVVVQGLEEMVVKNATEIYQVLDRGTSKRRTAETLLNKRSSRSHR